MPAEITMPRPHPALNATLILAGVPAQQPAANQPEPLALISRAEKLLQKKDKEVEDATLLLWQALDQLARLPSNPINEAAVLSARFLLKQNDPREDERRRVYTAIATQQVELATAYRAKKWLEIAAGRLDIADLYDRDAGAKERAALDALRAKTKPAETVKPASPATAAAAPVLAPLLQRAALDMASGNWTVKGDILEIDAMPRDAARLDEWITKATHDDHEIVVELRPDQPRQEFNAAIGVGLHIRAQGEHFSGFRCYCQYFSQSQSWGLFVWQIAGMQTTQIADESRLYAPPAANGFHRLAVRVSGNLLRVQIDELPPLEVRTATPVRGVVGLLHGLTDTPSCKVQFRDFRIDPLPADAPTDEEIRAKAEAANQNAIVQAVDDAKGLLAKKQAEAAALRLRDALGKVDEMAAGVLRDNLRKTVDTLLTQADPLAPKRKKTALTIAMELGTLADTYATAGWVRAASVLAGHAADFGPESQTARLSALREQVVQWNVTQAKARAEELLPPADDGAMLRVAFAKGRKLDTTYSGMEIEGAAVRAQLGMKGMATWLPHPLFKPATKASIHVRLPAEKTIAGFYFDVVDHTQLGLVTLDRRSNGLYFAAWAKLAGKWVPLMQKTIPMDAWRLDGWHQITIEAGDSGLLARCGTTELKAPRKLLGKLTGTFGLYANNESSDAAVVEFRAFQVGP